MARILIADDQRQIVDLLKAALIKTGHDVVHAYDGEQTLELLAEQECDLVICDILMPHIDGLTTISRIHDNYPGICIIAISGGGRIQDPRFLNYAIQLGATATLKKPFLLRDLTKLVESFIHDDPAKK